MLSRSVRSGTDEEIEEAEDKLYFFQKMKTSKRHIAAVNSFITTAQEWAHYMAVEKACKHGGKIDDYIDKFYHRRMNELTRAAGLRI